MKNIIIMVALLAPVVSFATPKHFDSITSMMADFNDYPPSEGDFNVLKEKPLSVTISPMVMPGDGAGLIEKELQKAVVYAAYRAFIHTDATQITITSFPRELNFQTHKSLFLKNKSIKLTLTRSDALKNVQKYLEVTNLSELVEENGTTFTPGFKNCCYLPEGHPGLKSFYTTLAKK